MATTVTTTEADIRNHPWAQEALSGGKGYTPRMWERMVGGKNDFPTRYACAKTFTVSPWVFRILGWLYIGLCIAFFVNAMVDPSACEPPMLFARPCCEEVALGEDVIITGIVETIPCGNECNDCFFDWFGHGGGHGEPPESPAPTPPARRMLGMGGHHGGYHGAEAYSLRYLLRDADREDVWDSDAVDSFAGQCPRHDSVTNKIACVEVCKASLVFVEGWELAACQGECSDGLWVSRVEEDCVVLGGSTEHADKCNGDYGELDLEGGCNNVGAPFSEHVSDWMVWDNIDGMSYILTDGQCRAPDDDDDDCGGDDGCKESKKRRRRGGEGDRTRSLLAHVEPEDGVHEDIAPHGVDEDDVIWITLPEGDFSWLRGRRRSKVVTAALVVTTIEDDRYVVPFAQSMNGPPIA